MILRDYLAHLSDYSVLLHNLEIEIDGLHNIFIRRLSLMSPFVNIYHETVNKLE